MGDVSSGMASTVIQVYLKAILESFINPDMVSLFGSVSVRAPQIYSLKGVENLGSPREEL
jgi:hypothetical protein